MTLFKMAFKNIRRNFRSYLIYFASMVFSIMIYHVFTSIQYNQQVLELQDAKTSIFLTFKTSSIVIAIFAGIFIWYSNAFFIRRRKKEVALYSLMGVRKRQIGTMLFYENIFMGILALGTGILLGSLLSKLFVMLLLQLMGYSIHVRFDIQLRPMIDTAVMFSILFLITSIHGYSIIYRFKLIDLFNAENKGQGAPKTSWITAAASVALVGGGYTYYLTVRKLNPLVPFLTLALVVAGTYLLFSSLSVYLIKLAKKDKASYYKGINLISTSQLMYRLKSHSKTLATIAVLSATTLTAMGVTATIYYDFQKTMNEHYPFSYVILSEQENLDKLVENVIAKYPQHSIESATAFEMVYLEGKLPDIGFYEEYRDKSIGIISQDTFNKIAEARGLKERVYLDFNKDISFTDAFYSKAFMRPYDGKQLELMVDGKLQGYHIKSFRSKALLNDYTADYIAVVTQETFEQLKSQGTLYWGKAYRVDNQKNSEALTDDIAETMKSAGISIAGFPRSFSPFYYRYKAGMINSGLTIFIGAFLGLVFLMATGSIIFFKQLSEANEDKKRYQILRNIGFDRKDIRAVISRQMLFVFTLPLAVGIVHSIVAVYILKKAMDMNVLIPLIITIGAYTLIYMIYYLLTVDAYSRIVEDGR